MPKSSKSKTAAPAMIGAKRKPDSSPSMLLTPRTKPKTKIPRVEVQRSSPNNGSSTAYPNTQAVFLAPQAASPAPTPQTNFFNSSTSSGGFPRTLPKPDLSAFDDSTGYRPSPHSTPPTPSKSTRKPSPVAKSIVVNVDYYLTTPEQQMFRTPSENDAQYYAREFDQLREIGHGSFGTVFQVRNRSDGKEYAVKRKNREDRSCLDIKRTVAELTAAFGVSDHPNCVRHYQAWEEQGHLFIQTELCDQSLEKWLIDHVGRPVEEEQIWQFLLDLSLGLQHIHSQGFVHLDIKPANTMISYFTMQDKNRHMILKIGDFGQAISIAKFKYGDVETDSTYIAPELWNNT